MIRNETFTDGVCVFAEVIDIDSGTYTVEEHGVVVESRPLTGEERVRYAPFPPLDAAGALATLLVVHGVLPLQDAANAVAEGDAAHLIAEAEAWAVAAP